MKNVKTIFVVSAEGFEDVAFDNRQEAIEYYEAMKADHENVELSKTIVTTERLRYQGGGIWL